MAKFTKLDKAFEILSEYNGINPYLLRLKKDVFTLKNTSSIGDFQVEYILNNHDFEPKPINKTIKIADWYAEKKKEDWGLDFIPNKIKIITYLGETTTTYNCYVQYRKSVNPVMCFLPKKGVLTNFLVEDYNKINVDFERYNRLMNEKDTNRKLRSHQEEAVKFLLSRKQCILADDMGMGKSASLSVSAIEGNYDSILIICPASLKMNWKNELMWFIPERDITIVEGFLDKKKSELEKFLGYGIGKSGKKKEELLLECKSNGKWAENRFVIINFDILSEFYEIPSTRSKENIDSAFANSPMLKYIMNKKSLVIIDEAHRLSNSKSGQYKIIKDLFKRGNPDGIYLSTGTPITNDPTNLFCLLQLLKDPISNDWNYYMERYCGAKKIPAKGEWAKWLEIYLKQNTKKSWAELSKFEKDNCREFIMNKSRCIITTDSNGTNLDELKERISHIYLRRTKESVSTLDVNKEVHEIMYELTPKQQDEYERLWDEYEQRQFDEDPDKELNKALLEGAIYRKYLSNAMVPNTISIVDKLLKRNEKVVIACCYDEELYTLRDYYNDSCVIYNGKLNLKKKEIAIDKFKNDPNINVFIGNIDAAAFGITLTVARYLVFNNISYVPSDDQQMEDRIYRIGQTRDCHIIYQLFKNTQYENMWNIILKKDLVINKVIKTEDEKK